MTGGADVGTAACARVEETLGRQLIEGHFVALPRVALPVDDVPFQAEPLEVGAEGVRVQRSASLRVEVFDA